MFGGDETLNNRSSVPRVRLIKANTKLEVVVVTMETTAGARVVENQSTPPDQSEPSPEPDGAVRKNRIVAQ